MSRTKKDIRRSGRMYIGIGQKMKQAAKEKRKTLKNETNPRVLKLKSANLWDFC